MRYVMSGVFRAAIDNELMLSNPSYRIGKPFTSKRSLDKTIDPLTAEELRHLICVVERESPEHYPLFLLLDRTGMRIGETLVLKWGDIDFRGRFVNVQRGVVRGMIDSPKSGKPRPVDISAQLAEALKRHKVESIKKRLALGLGERPEFVFTNKKGGLIDKDNWRKRVFHRALEKAGLRQIRIHDLRHTYATLRISKGDNIADVSNQLGHFSPQLTLDIYYHWLPGNKKHEVDGLDDLGDAQPSATYPLPNAKRG